MKRGIKLHVHSSARYFNELGRRCRGKLLPGSVQLSSPVIAIDYDCPYLAILASMRSNTLFISFILVMSRLRCSSTDGIYHPVGKAQHTQSKFQLVDLFLAYI